MLSGTLSSTLIPGMLVEEEEPPLLSTEDLIILEQQYMWHTSQIGPITKIDALHELLWGRCGERTVTKNDLYDALASLGDQLGWAPDSTCAISMRQFITVAEELRRLKLKCGPRTLSNRDCEILFLLLSSQTEFIPTKVAAALCALLDHDGFMDNHLDYVGREGFINTIVNDADLARRLAVKKQAVFKGVLRYQNIDDADIEEILGVGSVPDDSEMLERWYRITEDNVESVLREAFLLVEREEAERLEMRRQLQNTKSKYMLSYFSPEEVIPSDGATSKSSKVVPIVISAPEAEAALNRFDDTITAQALVGRVAELRRVRNERKKRQLLEDSEEAPSASERPTPRRDSTNVSPTPSRAPSSSSHYTPDSRVAHSVVFKGLLASERLFPHLLSPSQSIQKRLQQKIGLQWAPAPQESSSLRSCSVTPQPLSGCTSSFLEEPIASGPPPPWRRGYRPFTPSRDRTQSGIRKGSANASGANSLFFRPWDPRPLESNFSGVMPKYNPPPNPQRFSASGLPLHALSKSKRGGQNRKSGPSEGKGRKANRPGMGFSTAPADPEDIHHEACLLLFEARSVLRDAIHRSVAQ
jgi:hypothetical protein